MSSLGLVLSGGGARAAYQAGVLAAIADICAEQKVASPFSYYSGLSAGAINTALLASTPACHFTQGIEKLLGLWSNIHSDQVFKSDPLELSMTGLHWIADLSLGGMKKNIHGKSLLQTSPLRKLLEDNCDFKNIQKNIEHKKMKAIAISAMDYFSNDTVTFIQGADDINLWKRARRKAEKTTLDADHVLASAAIPLLFPPVQIGERYFGDGCIRNQSPCGPVIYMGARKILAIGVRCEQDVCTVSRQTNQHEPPTVARIASVLLNAVMMDGLEMDIERMERINLSIENLSKAEQDRFAVKKIDYLWIAPSQDFSKIADKRAGELPRMIRYLLRGLGSLHEASEIASFLLFDSSYCKELADIGFNDGRNRKADVLRLLES